MLLRVRDTLVRHATVVAAVVLVLSTATFVVLVLVDQSIDDSSPLKNFDPVFAACQVLPFGVVGAVLVGRRPDLPFGWLLSAGAMALVVGAAAIGTSYEALRSGHGGELAVWGLSLAPLLVVPLLLQGPINLLFPSGRAEGRFVRMMSRALAIGIVVALVGGILGDGTVTSTDAREVIGDQRRFIDGTFVTDLGNALSVATPLVILLGVVAGIRIVVRCFRTEGVERKQLQWRAVGVVASLMLFPFAVTETLPTAFDSIDPFLFVVTLMVPVLRYDLWAIDSLIRRSAAYTLTSSGTTVENLVRAVGEMLRLSHVAVRRGQIDLAAYGVPGAGTPETWPLEDERGPVGELIASPRHGRPTLDDQDRQVLATVARLVTESVRADLLTADLLHARQLLVAAREEERRRLRRDLHDGLGPLLTGLGLSLDAARDSLVTDDAKTSTYLTQAKDVSSQVIQDLRTLVHDLRPPALDELGLAGAIRLHAERITRDAGIRFEMNAEEHLQLSAAVEVAAFRTAVEAVTNTVRHSDATRVEVVVAQVASTLRVSVTDDGSSAAAWRPGIGLTGMRERAEELGGTMSSGPISGGGHVVVTYPLEVSAR